MFLLDTNVLSEPTRRSPDAGVTAWLAGDSGDEQFISVVSIGELARGVERALVRDPPFGHRLSIWLADIASRQRAAILDFDLEAARIWGAMMAQRNTAPIDTMLSATAKLHGLTVVTRNVRDFADRGVAVLNPFQDSPA